MLSPDTVHRETQPMSEKRTATRTWRLDAVSELGSGEGRRQARREIGRLLQGAKAQHRHITVRERYDPPPVVGERGFSRGIEEILTYQEQIERTLGENTQYWNTTSDDDKRDADEIKAIEDAMASSAYRGTECDDKPLAQPTKHRIEIVLGREASPATLYMTLAESALPMRLVQQVAPHRRWWGVGTSAQYSLWIESDEEHLEEVAEHAARKSRARLGQRPGHPRRLGIAEEVAMSIVASGDPGTHRSPWTSAPIAAFRTLGHCAFRFHWHANFDPGARGHTLIVGRMGRGKSTLAGHLAGLTRARSEARIWALTPAREAQWFARMAGVEVTQDAEAGAPARIGVMNVKAVMEAEILTRFTDQVHEQAFDQGRPCLVWIDAVEAFARTPELVGALRIAMLEGRKSNVAYVLCTRTLKGLDAIVGLAGTHIVMPGAAAPGGGIETLKLNIEALKAIGETHRGRRSYAFVVRDGRTMGINVGVLNGPK